MNIDCFILLLMIVLSLLQIGDFTNLVVYDLLDGKPIVLRLFIMFLLWCIAGLIVSRAIFFMIPLLRY